MDDRSDASKLQQSYEKSQIESLLSHSKRHKNPKPPKNGETISKIALITGITGQDGSYLAEYLIEKGYTVHGIIRRSSSFNTARINHIYEPPSPQSSKLILHYGDLTDSSNLLSLIMAILPDEIYNLAAQSHVKVSFEMPEYTANVNGCGVLRILEAIKAVKNIKKIKFYQASTSELYGKVLETPQNENTPFNPCSPYAISKLFAYWTVKNYRQAYQIHASNGILFNHESPRRGPTFVTRKISRAVARLKSGGTDCLTLGNLEARRDWGHAKDYVHMMWLMLQQERPDDYVVATGETHSVRDFVEVAFGVIGVNIAWKGSGLDEIGVNASDGRVLVRVHERYFRPSEVDFLQGDATKARKVLGWRSSYSFKELVKEMVESDLKNIQNGSFVF